jgi:dTDP-4-dehydrorhamnose reductase
VLRTSWVIGEGRNFIETMVDLARKGVHPKVVNDQVGRLTFASDLASGIEQILSTRPPFGVYNISNDGAPASWFDIAARVFESVGVPASAVEGVSTEQYCALSEGKLIAPRPLNSTFSLEKLRAQGITLRDQWLALDEYMTAHHGG